MRLLLYSGGPTGSRGPGVPGPRVAGKLGGEPKEAGPTVVLLRLLRAPLLLLLPSPLPFRSLVLPLQLQLLSCRGVTEGERASQLRRLSCCSIHLGCCSCSSWGPDRPGEGVLPAAQ